MAWIQAQPGVPVLDEENLRAYPAQRLAAYKLPVQFLSAADLPRIGTGKVDRVLLRERAMDQLGEELAGRASHSPGP